MALADVLVNLRLNTQQFSAALAGASNKLKAFTNSTNKQYGEMAQSLKLMNLDLKDTARIVQGIIVSQAFYQAARAIGNATDALFDFNEQLDYAQVTYSALFGDSTLATSFLDTLKEHSINTIFQYDQLAEASKKMLAYGIEYKNLMFVMRGLTNLGAMSGDAEALDRISYAIGQIYAKGTLKAEEMRQLANAYVPIQSIIKEKFNLSEDQLASVGDLQLPAEDVINAIVDYANKKFGSVGEAAMYTVTGLKNRIVDTMKVLGTDMLSPAFTAWKSFLAFVANAVDTIRTKYEEGGIKGVFEYLVPDPATQTNIRAFIANLMNMLKMLVSVGATIGSILKPAIQALIVAFNVVSPIITGVVNAFARLINTLATSTTGMYILRTATIVAAAAFIILKAQALGALVIVTLTKAVEGLSKALLILATIITKHPIIAMIMLIGVSLLGVAAASNNANNSLSNLFKTLSGFGGTSSQDNVLQGVADGVDDINTGAGEFDNRLESGADAAGELADNLDKAGKSAKKGAKDLLAFDEVFRLTEDSSSGGSIDSGGLLDDLASGLDGLGGLGDFEIPDFSDYISDFTDGLFGGLKDSWLAKLAAAGLGAFFAKTLLDSFTKAAATQSASKAATIASTILKNIAKALMGGFIGYGIDTALSLLTENLWNTLEEKLKLSGDSAEQAALGSTIASVIGGAIGMIMGGPLGSVIGAAIGHFAGGFVGLFWDTIGGFFNNTAMGLVSGIAKAISKAFGGAAISTVFKTLVSGGSFSSIFSSIAGVFKATGLKNIAKGGLIGMAIGFVCDAIAGLLWDTLIEKFQLGENAKKTAQVGQTIGSIIGTVIGGLLGGPVGAMIGSAAGTFAGGLIGVFWEPIKTFFSEGLQDIIAKFIAWRLTFKTVISNWAVETKESISSWVTETSAKFIAWHLAVKKRIRTWVTETKENIANWVVDTSIKFVAWQLAIKERIRDLAQDTAASITAWVTDTAIKIAAWRMTVKEAIHNWAEETREKVGQWVQDTSKKVVYWSISVIAHFAVWRTNVRQSISDWASETKAKFDTWISNVGGAIGVFLRAFKESISGKLNEIKITWTVIWNSIYKLFAKWWTDLKTSVGTWLNENIWQPIADFFSLDKFWQRLRGLLDAIKNKIKGWWNGVKSIFDSDVSVNASVNMSGSTGTKIGHATGGIFNREHVARFAEGNKAEAVIPLENAAAMQPFVDLITNGITAGLAPQLAAVSGNSNANNLPPVYVGTLIADDRGLRELERKMRVVRLQEERRGN